MGINENNNLVFIIDWIKFLIKGIHIKKYTNSISKLNTVNKDTLVTWFNEKSLAIDSINLSPKY